MGMKYCPNCRKVVLTKVLYNCSQIDFMGIRGKRRKIVHLEEDGGCGHCWYTVEVLEDVLVELNDLSHCIGLTTVWTGQFCGKTVHRSIK